jgi:DNA invertase Pin-like site-specific DNA recombinase
MEYIREGDILYIESISRLARRTRDLLSIVQQLQYKKVELVSLKENIDTATPQGRFVLTIPYCDSFHINHVFVECISL